MSFDEWIKLGTLLLMALKFGAHVYFQFRANQDRDSHRGREDD